jgi:hypothetical protein
MWLPFFQQLPFGMQLLKHSSDRQLYNLLQSEDRKFHQFLVNHLLLLSEILYWHPPDNGS